MMKEKETAAAEEDFIVGDEIGAGRFGTVRQCTSRRTGKAFAMKTIDMSAVTDALELECLEREARLTGMVSGHPHVIGLHGVYSSPTATHLVLDLCSPLTLYDRMAPLLPLPEPQARSLFRTLMSAVAHCHRAGVAHRDVKPENILFDGDGRLRLADLGAAGEVGRGAMAGLVGTPAYVAPEVLEGGEYDEKVDVWSAGVVLYVMLGGEPPFAGGSPAEVLAEVARGRVRFPVGVWRGVSHDAKDLLRRMLCRDVWRRPTAEQVLRHPWLAGAGAGGEDDEEGTWNASLLMRKKSTFT